MRETIIDLNGHPTRVMQSGTEGPAILLLHGFPEYSGAWEEVMAALPNCRCYAPDQRGYGISYRPEAVEEYAAGRLARDMLDLIGALGLNRIHVVGHDWGASVAYAVAFANDPRVVSLTILNGVHPIPFQKALAAGRAQTAASQYIPWLKREGSEDILAANGFARLRALFAEGMDMSWLTGARLEAYKAAWKDATTLRAMVNWYRTSPLAVPPTGKILPDDQLPYLPADRMRVRIPHLLVWGMGDMALLPEARAGLGEFCADLTVHEIEGADHWLHHQKPAEVADLIRAFIAERD
ncbi:MAG: alpha/beta hydrolase [Pseudomonadota bacterium]